MVYKELDWQAVGFRITEARARLRLTVEDIADRTGLSRPSMYKYEGGKPKGQIYFKTLIQIANALEVDLLWLCYGDIDHSEEINLQLEQSYQKIIQLPLAYKIHLIDMIEIMDDYSSSRQRKNDQYKKMSSRISYNGNRLLKSN